MNISEFRSKHKKGFAPASRYSVSWHGNLLYPESITLPSRSYSVFTHSLFGSIVQYPYRETYNDNIVMTFPEVADGSVRMFWEDASWAVPLGAALPHVVNTGVANLVITQEDTSNRNIGEYNVFGAYVIGIVPSNLGYGMMNETSKVQVMIKYYRYQYG